MDRSKFNDGADISLNISFLNREHRDIFNFSIQIHFQDAWRVIARAGNGKTASIL